jgi:hypothetical protein
LAIHYLNFSYNAHYSFPLSFLHYFLSRLFFLLVFPSILHLYPLLSCTFLSFLYYFFIHCVLFFRPPSTLEHFLKIASIAGVSG